MRTLTAVCLAAGAAAILGLGAAQAKPQSQTQTMTIQLPFGGVETIQYTGNRAPLVKWSDPEPFAKFDPFLGFADFDRIFATMNQQMADFDRQMAVLERNAASAQANGVTNAGTGGASGSFCAESVEMTQTGNQPPHVVRRAYGSCAAPTANADAAAHAAAVGVRT